MTPFMRQKIDLMLRYGGPLVILPGLFQPGCSSGPSELEEPTPPLCAVDGENELLVNPSAEDGLEGWQTDGPFITAAEVQPYDGCEHFFAGVVSTASIWQTVDLTQADVSLEEIDAGRMVMVAGGYQRTYEQLLSYDDGQIVVTARDAAGLTLVSWEGPVRSPTTWDRVALTEPLPPSTRALEFKFIATRNSGDDNDAYLDAAFLWLEPDADGDGTGTRTGDCNDNDPDVGAGQLELCDGIDNNCDGQVDEGAVLYRDVDEDGYGDQEGLTASCTSSEPGYVTEPGDCDDSDPGFNPDAVDLCDNQDRDCDGYIENPCNLLINPGAEDGIDGWQGEPRFGVDDYLEPMDGDFYFFAGQVDEAVLSQAIDLIEAGFDATSLDAGSLVLEAGGYQRSYPHVSGYEIPDGGSDPGTLSVDVLDAGGSSLGVLQGSAVQENDHWVLTELSMPLPPGARTLVYRFTAVRYNGEDNDAYLDAAYLWVE